MVAGTEECSNSELGAGPFGRVTTASTEHKQIQVHINTKHDKIMKMPVDAGTQMDIPVPFLIQGEIMIVGTRTPSRSNLKKSGAGPVLPSGLGTFSAGVST